jgi:hypothetical protein
MERSLLSFEAFSSPAEAFYPAAHNVTPYGKFPDEAFPITA